MRLAMLLSASLHRLGGERSILWGKANDMGEQGVLVMTIMTMRWPAGPGA